MVRYGTMFEAYQRTMATSTYKVGQGTLAVPMALFATNRARLVERLRARAGATPPRSPFSTCMLFVHRAVAQTSAPTRWCCSRAVRRNTATTRTTSTSSARSRTSTGPLASARPIATVGARPNCVLGSAMPPFLIHTYVWRPWHAGAIHVASGKAVLFIPRLPESYAVWMGKYVARAPRL